MSVVLSEHLPLLSTAPDGVQKLRGLILELAVRGKLALQDPQDEPASDLLKRIARERARLEANGVRKKNKETLLSDSDAEPFELPRGWALTNLASIALINPRNAADDSVGASFVPMAMIGNRFDGSHQQELRKWGEVKQGFTHFAEGDIGVAKITPCFENSKACVFAGLQNGIGAGTTELHIIRPFAQTLEPRYVLAYLKAPMFLAAGETKMTGTAGQKRLPKDFLESNPFPLPPLAEQRRIVAKADELMALCDRLEAEQAHAESAQAKLVDTLLGTLTQSTDAADLVANWQRLAQHFDILFTTESSLEALKQTILQLAIMGKLVPQDSNDEPAIDLLKQIAQERAQLVHIGKIRAPKSLDRISASETTFSAPAGWEWVKLGSVVELINGDRSKNYPNREEYVPTGVPWINTGHIQPDGTLATVGMHYITREKFDSLRSGKIEQHDLVYCLRGATFGKTAFVTPYSEGAIASSLVIVRPYLPALRRFLFLYLTSPFGRSQIFRFDNGSAQPNLSANSVTLFALAIPPLAEQHRIVAKVDELMALCDRLKGDLAQSRNRQARLASTLIETALDAA
ncbi:restriction endonuclease subunit S [Pseudoduganella sp. GCM10020061]|uniref:restriction endonuclease subunit S n=1 Tax=Pseudoduganella sp. GCM10020061 TaxID=3317345 RepID=UPI0036300F0F